MLVSPTSHLKLGNGEIFKWEVKLFMLTNHTCWLLQVPTPPDFWPWDATVVDLLAPTSLNWGPKQGSITESL
ncbi:hypothetical protein SESBI_01349 [Sesbania bispinosa]|nr:hypothetical protein SESBI_01349 [Sesbania bispinosa]